ncbi:MAG TPA: addiction module protein [Rhizomicrobium sp.]|jgi:putative addiction module component (TIGR02574 family)
MAKEAADLLKEVLSLPVEARAAFADCLLESLDSEIEPGAYDKWQREIKRRAAELDSGAVKAIPWTEAKARLRALLRDGE